MSQVLYYVLPSVRVIEFRAMAGAYIRGVPQPTAVAGMIHAVSRKLVAQTGVTLQQHAAVAYAVSEWSGYAGISRHLKGTSDTAPGDRSAAATIDDRVRASVKISLIVELVIGDDDTAPTIEQFVKAVEAARLQGASMFVGGGAQPRIVEDLSSAIRYLPTDCFVLVDANTEVSALVSEGQATTAAIASLISRPTNGEYKPRYAPALVGWRALEEPTVRDAQRLGAAAHAFAEPVIGVARFMSKGSARALALSDNPKLFWAYAAANDEGHYVLSGAEPYTQEFVF